MYIMGNITTKRYLRENIIDNREGEQCSNFFVAYGDKECCTIFNRINAYPKILSQWRGVYCYHQFAHRSYYLLLLIEFSLAVYNRYWQGKGLQTTRPYGSYGLYCHDWANIFIVTHSIVTLTEELKTWVVQRGGIGSTCSSGTWTWLHITYGMVAWQSTNIINVEYTIEMLHLNNYYEI